jgi:tetratricopeptide (TPR) repeat protein
MRLEDPLKRGGFVECGEIHQLPGWGGCDIASVGKQVDRWLSSLPRICRHVIEARQKIQGPFRLRASPNRVHLDVPLDTVTRHLLLSSTQAAGSIRPSFTFSAKYWSGVREFNNGSLSESIKEFQAARRLAPSAIARTSALNYLQRIFERQGDTNKANDAWRQSQKLLDRTGRYRTWAEAKGLILAAWRQLRRENLAPAERLYLKALRLTAGHGLFQVTGEIRNGLGVIESHRGRYVEAIDHFLYALDSWMIDDYFYGFQSAYFNIGVVYRGWGDRLRSEGLRVLAKQRYELAVEWAKACVALCYGHGLGYDTSEAEALLASLHLKLGRLDKATKYANDALTIAQESGDQRSLALALRSLARIYLARGQEGEAIALISSNAHLLKLEFRALLGPKLLALMP